MLTKIQSLFVVLIIGVTSWGCSSETEPKTAHISGSFTVSDSIDSSGDFSGIGFTIIKKDSANADADTLYHAVTNSNGSFSGMATFQEKRRYPLIISRNSRNLARGGVILAEDDSVFITGQLPNVRETLNIASREHNAMDTYQRLGKSFRRVMQVARAGQLQGDTLRDELQKWTNLYWDVYEHEEGTFASNFAAREAIKILESFDKPQMMNRIRMVDGHDDLSDLGATFGKRYMAENRGLDSALGYLDSLAQVTESENSSKRIAREKIKLLYDSARVEEAKQELIAFKREYPEDSTSNWVESMSYDINYLSPGDTIPEFQFVKNGRVISRDSLAGAPYILEVTRLSNQLYQEQFDRTVVIHSIYKNYGLEVVTLPLDESQVTVDAFFEERVKPWPVADAQAFDRKALLEKFNIRLIPTRFLVDEHGQIIRKYVGNEFEDVIQGIQKIINKDNNEEPAS
jgi:glutathione peroxidase-family protein